MKTQTEVEYIHAPAELIELTKAGVEVWRPVVGSDGMYEVSNLGRVRSHKRKTPALLTAAPITGGYLAVGLRIGGKQRCGLVHCLMAEAFICPRPGSYRIWQAGHDDDDPNHNTLDNIRWCTALANTADRIRNGGICKPLRPFEVRNGVKHYRCTGPCGKWKAETEFRKLAAGANSRCGIHSQCRPCMRVRDTERRRLKRQAA